MALAKLTIDKILNLESRNFIRINRNLILFFYYFLLIFFLFQPNVLLARSFFSRFQSLDRINQMEH